MQLHGNFAHRPAGARMTVAPTSTATARRIAALDVIRGIAIAGTLGTNIWIFTDPRGPAAALGPASSADFAALFESALLLLTNGKFLALLTMLFGIGLELQYRSALRRGRTWPGWYLWRAALLFVEGLLHYVLVFEYDVLMSYAVTSVLVAFLIGRSERAVNWWMGAMATAHVLFIGLLTAALVSGTAKLDTGASAPFPQHDYPAQVAARLSNWPEYRLEAIFIIPMSAFLFLLGAKLHRAGVFEAGNQRLRNRLMLIGFGVGGPLNLVTAFAGEEWFVVDRYLLPPLIAAGLLGLVPTALHRASRGAGPLRNGLTAVGRTALSCYVFQNLAAAVLCYGWGLGLAEELDALRPWWVLLAWAGIFLTCAVGASLWLRKFSRGPVELVWHWAHQVPQRR